MIWIEQGGIRVLRWERWQWNGLTPGILEFKTTRFANELVVGAEEK